MPIKPMFKIEKNSRFQRNVLHDSCSSGGYVMNNISKLNIHMHGIAINTQQNHIQKATNIKRV